MLAGSTTQGTIERATRETLNGFPIVAGMGFYHIFDVHLLYLVKSALQARESLQRTTHKG